MFELTTHQHNPRPRLWYLLTLGNGKSRARVNLALTKEIVALRRYLVSLEEIPEDRRDLQVRSLPD